MSLVYDGRNLASYHLLFSFYSMLDWLWRLGGSSRIYLGSTSLLILHPVRIRGLWPSAHVYRRRSMLINSVTVFQIWVSYLISSVEFSCVVLVDWIDDLGSQSDLLLEWSSRGYFICLPIFHQASRDWISSVPHLKLSARGGRLGF